MNTAGQHLREHTLNYWTLSSTQRGRFDSNITSEAAGKKVRHSYNNLGTHRVLFSRIVELRHNLIIGLPRIKTKIYPPHFKNVIILDLKRIELKNEQVPKANQPASLTA